MTIQGHTAFHRCEVCEVGEVGENCLQWRRVGDKVVRTDDTSCGDKKNGVEVLSPTLAELCINLSEGQAVISPKGNIEFYDIGLNISLRNLQFVVQEAEAYMKYKKERAGRVEEDE